MKKKLLYIKKILESDLEAIDCLLDEILEIKKSKNTKKMLDFLRENISNYFYRDSVVCLTKKRFNTDSIIEVLKNNKIFYKASIKKLINIINSDKNQINIDEQMLLLCFDFIEKIEQTNKCNEYRNNCIKNKIKLSRKNKKNSAQITKFFPLYDDLEYPSLPYVIEELKKLISSIANSLINHLKIKIKLDKINNHKIIANTCSINLDISQFYVKEISILYDKIGRNIGKNFSDIKKFYSSSKNSKYLREASSDKNKIPSKKSMVNTINNLEYSLQNAFHQQSNKNFKLFSLLSEKYIKTSHSGSMTYHDTLKSYLNFAKKLEKIIVIAENALKKSDFYIAYIDIKNTTNNLQKLIKKKNIDLELSNKKQLSNKKHVVKVSKKISSKIIHNKDKGINKIPKMPLNQTKDCPTKKEQLNKPIDREKNTFLSLPNKHISNKGKTVNNKQYYDKYYNFNYKQHHINCQKNKLHTQISEHKSNKLSKYDDSLKFMKKFVNISLGKAINYQITELFQHIRDIGAKCINRRGSHVTFRLNNVVGSLWIPHKRGKSNNSRKNQKLSYVLARCVKKFFSKVLASLEEKNKKNVSHNNLKN